MSATAHPEWTEGLMAALANRRSIYALQPTSTIPDTRIQSLLAQILKTVPSSFNLQATRTVLLVRDAHRSFWAMVARHAETGLGAEAWPKLKPRVDGFAGAYGTVLFFEDEATLDGAREKMPQFQPLFGQWSEHSSGMHQIAAWSALEAEGLGANLQHFNFLEDVKKGVREDYGLPEKWDLKAQLVFGGWDGQRPDEKDKLPTEETVRVFGTE